MSRSNAFLDRKLALGFSKDGTPEGERHIFPSVNLN